MKIKDNYLPEETFKELQKTILSDKFPWYKGDSVATAKSDDGIYFIHTFYDKFSVRSDSFDLIVPIIEKINPTAILRVKANLYLRTPTLVRHGLHRDYEWPTNGMILSINTCNGGTFIKDEVVPSIENRALFFDPFQMHASTSCTDKDFRVNINFNYFGDGKKGEFNTDYRK
mgnify:FL=1